MKKQAFSSEQYLNLQRDHILERINQFDGKLYLEFGGKMLKISTLLVSFLVMNLTTKSSSCKN